MKNPRGENFGTKPLNTGTSEALSQGEKQKSSLIVIPLRPPLPYRVEVMKAGFCEILDVMYLTT
jgi:hypothetical protein